METDGTLESEPGRSKLNKTPPAFIPNSKCIAGLLMNQLKQDRTNTKNARKKDDKSVQARDQCGTDVKSSVRQEAHWDAQTSMGENFSPNSYKSLSPAL